MLSLLLVAGAFAPGFFGAPAASAQEAVTYTYDAKGRLVRVQHAGGPAAGVDKQYEYDKADNRKRVVVSGAASSVSSATPASAPPPQ